MSKKKNRIVIKEIRPEIISGIKKVPRNFDKKNTTETNLKLIAVEVPKAKQISLKEKTTGKTYLVTTPKLRNSETRTVLRPLPNKSSNKIIPKRTGAISGTEDLLPDLPGGKKNG